MKIDYEFIAEMLGRYYKHLYSVEIAINKNIDAYNKQISELERLAQFKPESYTSRLEEVREKVVQADIKLSHIVPRMARINEQLEEIKKKL